MNGDLNAAMNEGVRTGLMLAEVFSNVIALNIMRKSFEVKDLKLLNGTPLLPPVPAPDVDIVGAEIGQQRRIRMREKEEEAGINGHTKRETQPEKGGM